GPPPGIRIHRMLATAAGPANPWADGLVRGPLLEFPQARGNRRPRQSGSGRHRRDTAPTQLVRLGCCPMAPRTFVEDRSHSKIFAPNPFPHGCIVHAPRMTKP